MNLSERISQRRETHQQFQAMNATMPKRHEPETTFPGQFISNDSLAQEKEYEKQFNAFKRENGRYPAGDELDAWTRQQQQQQKAPEKIQGFDRDWDVSMRREAAAPVLKDQKPIRAPDPKAAIARVTEQRHEQAKTMDQSLDGKVRKLSK